MFWKLQLSTVHFVCKGVGFTGSELAIRVSVAIVVNGSEAIVKVKVWQRKDQAAFPYFFASLDG
jgi:hypothetical protein